MDLSFSELKDLIFNASLGSDLPAGIGEDLSMAVTFLESRSLPGGREFLNSLECKRHPTLLPQKKGSHLIFCNARAIFEGVTAIDFLVSGVCESVILQNIDSHMLLLGLASNYRGYSFSFYKNKRVCAGIVNDELVYKNERLIEYIVLLLENLNISYFISDTFNNSYSIKKYTNNCIDENMVNYLDKNNVSQSKGNHWLSDGHKLWSELLIKNIKNE